MVGFKWIALQVKEQEFLREPKERVRFRGIAASGVAAYLSGGRYRIPI